MICAYGEWRCILEIDYESMTTILSIKGKEKKNAAM
jgi:hypothetical protein